MDSVRLVAGLAVVATGAAAGVLIGGQQSEPPPEATTAVAIVGDWELGPFTVDVSTTVGASGGNVVVTEGALAGLTISLPEAAVPDNTPLTVEHAPIISHTWGASVDPVTPAIRIELGDGSYADDLLTVAVPVELADDQFALGLYVDQGGGLEGIPTAGSPSGGVEVVTRHFSDWFLSAFDPDKLPDEIYTGFQVARDNWQFVNSGSWISPRGICAGMSVSSMWYYLERYQSKDEAGLFNRFDYPHGAATVGFDGDDAHAVRFASMVQKDGNWGSNRRDPATGPEWVGSPTAWDWFRGLRYNGYDRWQFELFRYAMYLTGEPQYVTMGTKSAPGGHAIIAYAATVGTFFTDKGASVSGAQIWVADPNAPYSLRSLRFDTDAEQFLPYTSALSAGSAPLAFDAIGFAAKSAMFDWDLIATRYEEMLAGTVGDPKFPSVDAFQRVTDPATGVGSWVSTATPTPDAAGAIELVFWAGNDPTLVLIYEDGGTVPVARASVDENGGIRTIARLAPGLSGHTYKMVVYAKPLGADRSKFVDAKPLTIAPVPAPTTTTSTAPPTTLAPSTTATTTAPPTVPTTLPDCSTCPDGLDGLDCRLQCQEIGTQG